MKNHVVFDKVGGLHASDLKRRRMYLAFLIT